VHINAIGTGVKPEKLAWNCTSQEGALLPKGWRGTRRGYLGQALTATIACCYSDPI